MDYPFYVFRLGNISSELLSSFQELLSNHSAFALAPGFTPSYGLLQPQGLNLNGLDDKLLDELKPWFDPATLFQLKFNRMDPGKSLAEHSDLDGHSNDDLTMFNCFSNHRVHIPIFTNPDCKYYHRRSRGLRNYENKLETGGIYLYNDYVLHSVFNNGTTPRIHAVLKFADPQHIVKKKFIKQAGLTIGEYYEARPKQ